MKKKRILFLTAAYPYYPGEQFIEDEIEFWKNQTIANVCVTPASANGGARALPAGIGIDFGMVSKSKISKAKFIASAFFAFIFWRELIYIFINHGLCFDRMFLALKCVTQVYFFKSRLKKIIKKTNEIDVVYCYWNDVQAYAAVILKREGLIKKVISRAHGFDVYEDRRRHEYMPIKRQLINEFDCVLAISNKGKEYLQSTYDVISEKTYVSRLGVPIPVVFAKCTGENKLNLLSISFCVSVKRIDKIIDAISLVKQNLPDVEISWTHIGGGPLFEALNRLAKNKLNNKGIQYNFTGNMENADVKKYFEFNEVDMFINSSESEGVPVSIMEAMSYGVPAIAPNIGGVSEIVSREDDCLMSEAPSAEEISNLILQLKVKVKNIEFRKSIKNKIISNYDAKNNYHNLIDVVCAD